MKVGWIGLGHMGRPMAQRAAAHHDVLGHVHRREWPGLRAAGGRTTVSIHEVAAHAEVLCVSVFDDAQLQAALLGDRALADLKPGSIVAVHTTGAPDLLADLTAALPQGAELLDAPFSGTAQDAAHGRLRLLVGGRSTAIERARPVLSTFADFIAHVGPAGAGRRLKLINNLLFAAQVSLAAEALAAVEAAGLDLSAAVRALGQCSAASYALAKFGGEDPPQAVLSQIKPYLDKDVDLARRALGSGAIPTLFMAAGGWGARTSR